ncbi:MAG: tRNA uridine-5-carboxymethylaminomethyl(34) synthesis GTPase MnmE [Chlorobi bacterium]|nr:tRNA uridine-5-carboxymethylaminomethyl(34) synthesis GTPase MnmE [Chlorobiota bacterium]
MNAFTYSPDKPTTICALATPAGNGAIAVVRVSGPDSVSVCEKIFEPAGKHKKLSEEASHTIHLGKIKDEEVMVDEVLLSLFRKPHSYTGEDSVEISCHGSTYIQQKIIELLLKYGLQMARPGEFTLRAFMNGKFDLSQAEAVADLIASRSRASHQLALNQMRGGFSNRIKDLRKELLDFASLIELELDFSEEDVEFADRKDLRALLLKLKSEIEKLKASFKLGNVMKNGVPVAIIGKPNVGKSTLLNAILNEDKALVSEIPGTTRDTIEDVLNIQGQSFRFIDTAGLRDSSDKIENMGIQRTFEKIDSAKVILYVFDVSTTNCQEIKDDLKEFEEHISHLPGSVLKDKKFILIANKTDQLVEAPKGFKSLVEMECIFISAKRKENVNLIIDKLSTLIEKEEYEDLSIVSSLRHFEALSKSLEAVEAIEKAFEENLPSDLVAIDIKQALHYLGEITGQVTTDEILGNIFSRFCVGK